MLFCVVFFLASILRGVANDSTDGLRGARKCPKYESQPETPQCGGQVLNTSEVEVRCEDGAVSPFIRYCEFFVVTFPELKFQLRQSTVNVTIYNTIGCNGCPSELLEGVQFSPVLLQNGPRYWQMDSIVQSLPPPNAVGPDGFKKLGAWNGIGASIVGNSEAQLTSLFSGGTAPYEFMYVERSTVWRWRPRRQVYQILTDAGSVFTMQAYSLQVNPDMEPKNLLGLGNTLDLPQGWSYRCRVLGKLGLDVASNETGVATILQDELKNTYMLTTEAADDNKSCPLYLDEPCSEETWVSIETECKRA